ncbi:MAG: DNA primase [bacterium]|nr:DNA primase [bacterium]
MGRIPEQIIQQVLDAVDIVDLVTEYLTLKRAGAHYKGLCPFHQEKTPSFTVNPSLRLYKCFGCGKGGNVIGFVMEAEGLSFPQAVRRLADRAGIAVPDEDSREPETRTLEERLQTVNQAALDFFRKALQAQVRQPGPLADYLARRALGGEIQERFQLGWSADDWQGLVDYARGLGLGEDLLVQAGVCLRSESGRVYDRYRGRLIFPIRSVVGTVIGFGGRVIGEAKDQPKYINSPETPLYHKGRSLYGLFENKNEIRRERTVLLVEGYMDLIGLWGAGIRHVAATLGTALTPEQALLLKRFADRVIFLYDGDAAGQKAMARGAASLIGAGLDLRVCRLPEGQDPDDVVRNSGADEMRRLLDESADYFRYRIAEFRQRQDQATPAEFRDFVQNLAGAAGLVEDLLHRTQLVQRIAAASGIPVHEVDKLSREQLRRADHAAPATARDDVLPRLDRRALGREERRELSLFEIFLRNAEARDEIAESLDLDELGHPLLREAMRQAMEAHGGEDESVESWAHSCTNTHIRELALAALVEAPRPGDAEEARDLLRHLERARDLKRMREIQGKDEHRQEFAELLRRLAGTD